MMAGTSPSISKDFGLVGGARPQTSQIAGLGNNRLNGGLRNDLIYGGRGNDRIYGRRGNDQLYGGPGSDRIYGGRGNDQIYGGPGSDRIYGGPGNDQIYGETGNERIVDHRGAMTVFPGSGTNRVDVADGRGDDRVVCAPGSTKESRLIYCWDHGVVPLGVELVALDFDRAHLLVADLDFGGVGVGVEAGVDLQSGGGRG